MISYEHARLQTPRLKLRFAFLCFVADDQSQRFSAIALAQILAQPTNPKVCPLANRVRRARLTLLGV